MECVRFLGIAIFLAVALMLPFLLWHDALAGTFGSAAALERFGRIAWLVGIGLLVLDVVLPVPGTAVMAGLGFTYGTVPGGLIGAAGSVLSGLLAYGLCRRFGRGIAVRLAGRAELENGERLFAHAGGWLVAFSRWLPLLPEVIACLAGLSRMPFRAFLIALCCGSLPMSVAYAAMGSAGNEHPVGALVASIVVPPVLWLACAPLLRRGMRRRAEKDVGE